MQMKTATVPADILSTKQEVPLDRWIFGQSNKWMQLPEHDAPTTDSPERVSGIDLFRRFRCYQPAFGTGIALGCNSMHLNRKEAIRCLHPLLL